MRAGAASDTGHYVDFPQSAATARSPGSITTGILDPNDVAGYGICTHFPYEHGGLVSLLTEDMGRLFANLLTNAIKYNKDGGSVRLSGAVSDPYLRIDVADTGFGIPRESIPKLFEEFYRVKTPQTREITGTGLGLSIVKKIVQAHHGYIEVESVLEVGSTFSVFLPLADGPVR